MSIFDWLKNPFSGTDDDDQDTVPIAEERHDLYTVGKRFCTYYPDGVPSDLDTRQFAAESIEEAVTHLYGDCDEITPLMVEDLDQLLADARGNDMMGRMEMQYSGGQYLVESKVEQFREAFFDCFHSQQIFEMIHTLYHDAREDFGLEAMFDEHEVDGTVFHYEVRDTEPTQFVNDDSGLMSIDSAQFHEESVEMQQVAGQLHLGESQIIETIEEIVAVEAELLWDVLDVTGPETVDDGPKPIIDAMYHVQDNGGRVDMVVVDSDASVDVDEIEGSTVMNDSTGVMDVPFVVADTQDFGYRLTASDLTIAQPDGLEMGYVYRLQWAGNYAVFEDEKVSGPVE